MVTGAVKEITSDVLVSEEHVTFVGASGVPHFLTISEEAVPGPTAETALNLKVYELP